MGAVVLGTGPDKPRARIGLVLGAGGLTGAAWMTGALPALQQRLPQPAGDVEVIVGTSAGSVLAASLRCQASIEEMVGYQRGDAVPGLAGLPAIQHGPRPYGSQAVALTSGCTRCGVSSAVHHSSGEPIRGCGTGGSGLSWIAGRPASQGTGSPRW